MPVSHVLKAGADTVHWGYFDAKLKPVLTIVSGATITVMSISGGPEVLPNPDSGMDILPEYAEVHARHTKFRTPYYDWAHWRSGCRTRRLASK